jgi:hypothetical protein
MVSVLAGIKHSAQADVEILHAKVPLASGTLLRGNYFSSYLVCRSRYDVESPRFE